MNIKQSLQKFIMTLKPMTGKERVEHIWYHYKAHILFGLAILIFLIGLISPLLMKRYEILSSGVCINTDMTQMGVRYLTDDLVIQLNGDPQEQKAELNMSYFEDMNTTQQLDRNYSRAMAIMAQIDQNQLDYMIMDRTALDYYATQDIFEDLTKLLPQDILDQGTLIYGRAENETEEHPIAMVITDWSFVQNCVEHDKGVYIAFPGNTDREFTPEKIVEYLMNWS